MLYVPYVLMLRHENFFRFNRLVLLSILLLSLVLPLCNISALSLDHQPVVQAAHLQMLELGIPVHVMPEVEVSASPFRGGREASFSLFHLFTFIYIIGMVALLSMRLWQIARLQFGLKQGVLWHNDEQGVRIYCHAEDVAPFSWMKSIVISQRDYDEAGREIVLHEKGHIQGRHSWDVVLLTLVQMVQWWNPMCYMLGISLRDVHEYEADSYVLRQGVSAQGYQLLLIRKAVGSGGYPFANSFNHSLTKKRITMMKKSKSNPWMRARALYVIPVAALALSAFATPKFVAPIEETVTKLEGKGAENSASNDTIYNVVKERAKFPGGDEECYKFLAENIRYPKLCHAFGVQGRVIVGFVVEKDGSISHIEKKKAPERTLAGVDIVSYKEKNPEAKELPEEGKDLGDLLYEETKRVMEQMPKWEPAKDDEGNAVRSLMALPFMFRLQ